MTFFIGKGKKRKLPVAICDMYSSTKTCCNAIIARNGNIQNALALHIKSITLTTFAKFADGNVKRRVPKYSKIYSFVDILTWQLGFA